MRLGLNIVLRNGRYIIDDYYWEEDDAQCCVHGMKLRWQCDHCDVLNKKYGGGVEDSEI